MFPNSSERITQVGYWNSRDGIVMDPRQPVIWLSGSVNIPKDTSTLVENTTIRVMTVIVSMKLYRALEIELTCK